jgi:FkbM family methyltransferase
MTTIIATAKAVLPAPWVRFLSRVYHHGAFFASLRRLFYRRSMLVAQAGQDHWVWAEAFNEKRGGFFLDIGAYDGLAVSNTFILEQRYGWRGICIEANPDCFAELERNRRCLCLNVCLDREEGEVEFVLCDEIGSIAGLHSVDPARLAASRKIRLPTKTLMSTLRENGAPAVIDYLSIDVEDAEDRVLSGFDFSAYRFNTLTIERPSAELRETLRANGYCLIKQIPRLDCFYVHEQFVETYLNNLYEFHRKRHFHLRWA